MLYSAHIREDQVRVAGSKILTRNDSERIKYLTIRIFNFLGYLSGFEYRITYLTGSINNSDTLL